MSFIVKTTGSTTGKIVFSLEEIPPSGTTINSNTSMLSWTPTSSQGAKSYTFDIVAKKDSMIDREPITVNNVIQIPEPKDSTKKSEPEVDINTIAPFVDKTKDPQSYVDRYNNEITYKEWFDKSYPDITIYEAVGLEEPEFGQCGEGTELVGKVCEIIGKTKVNEKPWWQFW